MSYKNAALFDTLRTVAYGSITSSYALLGSVLPSPAVSIAFKNTTDQLIFVSFDGINDNLVFPSTMYQVYDIRTNGPQVTDYLLPQNTPILVKYSGTAPTSGSFYVEVLLAQV
jgi:hypothetical protein